MLKQLTIFLFVISTLFFSCSKYEKVLKGSDYNAKFAMAEKLYQQKKYVKAIPLLEDLIALYKLTEKGEKVYYYYAYSHYGMKEYSMASYYFKNFLKIYPNSKHSEECAFMSAYSNVMNSPTYRLDQKDTYRAIAELQNFLNAYPNSTKKDSCNSIITDLRFKLEEKAYKSAYLYYKMEDYKAASIAFKSLLNDYPDTRREEEIHFLILKSQYNLAINSVSKKKRERFEETIKSYTKFVDKFGVGEYSKEAEQIYLSSQEKLKLIKDEL